MQRNIQRNGLVNLLVLLVVGLAQFAAARYAGILAGQVAAAFLVLGVLVAAVSWFQMRLEEQERLEKLEFDEVTRGGAEKGLFNTQGAEAFPARRSREQFEKFFVPGFSILLFLLQAGGAFWVWRWLNQALVVPFKQPLVALAILALLALVLFIIGKYSSGLARLENQRLLGPSSNYLLLNAYLIGLVVAGVIAYEAGFAHIDLYAARVLCLLLVLMAVENAITLVLEIYRPRVKDKVERLLYESRLVGLLSRPEGIFTTAAHALDYQFGFKVSETWFYKFLQKAFAWLLLAQVGLLLASTCFVFIEVGEEALLERFGQPVGAGVLGPGVHLKLPWPIDEVYRFRTDEIHTFTVGHEHADEGHHGDEDGGVTLWTVSHTKEEFRLLVASRDSQLMTTNQTTGKESPPVKLLAASIPVQYQIKDLRAWAYNHTNPNELLEHLGTREVVRYLVNADFDDVISRGRFQGSHELGRRIQDLADTNQLGAKILFVGLHIHPPVAIGAAYEEVIAARHKREATLLAARAHALQTNAMATAESTRRIRNAEASKHRSEVGAIARVALYTNQIAAYRASPEVYSQRAYLEVLVKGSRAARKYILAATNTQDVIQFNLEEKLRGDLMDIGLPTSSPN